jgi:hypothetical protein
MRITQQNRKKVLKMLGNQIFSRLNYGDRNGGGLLKMAGIDYPRYLVVVGKVWDLLNFMIAMHCTCIRLMPNDGKSSLCLCDFNFLGEKITILVQFASVVYKYCDHNVQEI